MSIDSNLTPELEALANSLGLHTLAIEGQAFIVGRSNIEQLITAYSDPANIKLFKKVSQTSLKFCFSPNSDDKCDSK